LDEVYDSSEVVADNEDFVDTGEQEGMQPLSFDSDDSSDDANDMNIEYCSRIIVNLNVFSGMANKQLIGTESSPFKT